MRQEELRADLTSRIADILRRARTFAADTVEQRSWSPPEGGWSVGQVLEHLVANTESYLGPVQQLLTRPTRLARSGEVTWKPSIMGNLLVRSLRSSRRLPAPKIWQPGPAPRPEIVEAFLTAMTRLDGLIARAGDSRWEELRLGSPASSLVRLNLGDVFLTLVVHAERHLGQIDRIRSNPGYPEA